MHLARLQEGGRRGSGSGRLSSFALSTSAARSSISASSTCSGVENAGGDAAAAAVGSAGAADFPLTPSFSARGEISGALGYHCVTMDGRGRGVGGKL